MPLPAPQSAETVDTLTRLVLGQPPAPGCVTFVAFNQPPSAGTAPGTWTQRLHSDLDLLVVALKGRADQPETYVAPAWFAPGKGRAKASVLAKRVISADIDAKVMPGATPEVRKEAASRLAHALPCPRVIVDSGGGYHVHVVLPEADRVETYTDPADGVARVELLGRALRLWLEAQARVLFNAQVALDHCHGAERVWRVPPGWNAKAADGARALTADRAAWRLVRLEEPTTTEGLGAMAPADLGLLAPYLDAARDEVDVDAKASNTRGAATLNPPEGQIQPSQGLSVAIPRDVTRFVGVLLPKRLSSVWPMRDGDQSRHDWSLCSAMAEAGWAPELAATLLRARRRLLGTQSDREKADRPDYIARTVKGAYETHAPKTVSTTDLEPSPFPTPVLPDPVADYITKGSAALRCAPEAIALPLLTALGSAIGNSRRIRLKRTWSEPALLWSAVVMPSGRMKSPALELAVRGIDGAQAAATRAHKAAMTAYVRDLRKQKPKQARRGRHAPALDLEPDAPALPILQRFKVSDITIEALASVLAENPRGVLLVRDELAGWWKSFDAYRGGMGSDREHWLTAHRAGQMMVDRKIGRQVTVVPHGFIAVTGGIQPGTLRQVLTGPMFECGMAARLLLSQPRAPRRVWTEDDIPEAVERGMSDLFGRLLRLELDRDAGDALEPAYVDLSTDAKQEWINFYDRLAGQQEELDGQEDLSAAFSKLEAYAARLALIIEMTAWEPRSKGGAPTTVSRSSMTSAITLTDWFAAEARRIYTGLGRSFEAPLRAKAWEWLRGRVGPVTARDLTRGPRPFRDDVSIATAALDDLVAAGLVWRALDTAPGNRGWAAVTYVARNTSDTRGDGDTQAAKPATNGLPSVGVSPLQPDFGGRDA